jgi:5'-phosphate synthase pdxT subunit
VHIGVLALQGAFREHIYAIEALDAKATAVRLPEQLSDLDGLIIPGGESTAISKLMESYGFYEPIAARYAEGMAVWGTCAGAILIAKDVVDGVEGQRSLGLMDIAVRRNAYGRQIDSFEVDLAFAHIGEPFRGIFIRAPWLERVAEGIEILSAHEGHACAARGDRLMATTFHPELTGDPRVHRFFVTNVVGA